MDFLRCLCGGCCLLCFCISRRCFNTLCFSGGLCRCLVAVVGFLLLIFLLSKATVVLFYNAFRFSESTHKNLHIGITVLFECIGDFIRFVGNLRFVFFDFYLRRFSFFVFEKSLCICKLLFQLRHNFVLQVFDYYRLVLHLYYQVSHMAKLMDMDINIKRRLGRQ